MLTLVACYFHFNCCLGFLYNDHEQELMHKSNVSLWVYWSLFYMKKHRPKFGAMIEGLLWWAEDFLDSRHVVVGRGQQLGRNEIDHARLIGSKLWFWAAVVFTSLIVLCWFRTEITFLSVGMSKVEHILGCFETATDKLWFSLFLRYCSGCLESDHYRHILRC